MSIHYADVDTDWMQDARCAEVGLDVMFPVPDVGKRAPDYRPAKSICAGCPVVTACLTYALAHEGTTDKRARAGVFGGMTPEERAALARGRRVAA